MAQTDRQTDKKSKYNDAWRSQKPSEWKSTWWSLTTYDKGEQEHCAGSEFPTFVVKIYGGLEECPTTKNIHFQGAVQCKTQQRLNAMKKFLPTAHWEPASSAECLTKYAMKLETAIGEKTVVSNRTPYFSTEMVMKLLAIARVNNITKPIASKEMFWAKVRLILYSRPYLVGLLAKPDILRIYENTIDVWVWHCTCKITGQLMSEEELFPSEDDGGIVLPPVEDINSITLE